MEVQALTLTMQLVNPRTILGKSRG